MIASASKDVRTNHQSRYCGESTPIIVGGANSREGTKKKTLIGASLEFEPAPWLSGLGFNVNAARNLAQLLVGFLFFFESLLEQTGKFRSS